VQIIGSSNQVIPPAKTTIANGSSMIDSGKMAKGFDYVPKVGNIPDKLRANFQSGKVGFNPLPSKTVSNQPASSKTNSAQLNPVLDKPIALKNGQKRPHIHRYDLKIEVKKPKDEDEEFLGVKNALQKFLELILQADSTIILPPFYELE
jgi:hypothetical protein